VLIVDIEKRLGEFTVAAKFEAADGVTALFGPSGSGKTSIVNMVAGLVTPDRGRILCNGMLLFDSAGANLDYGRRMYRLAHDAAAQARIVKMLDIGHLLARRPGKLSGGERQRVAIGRALLLQPLLLLLDEPLASLDAARKREIFPYLMRLRDEAVPMIYVSHHAAEVKRIASTVVRLEDGRVIGVGGAEIIDTADADAL
jgi:molybdate transport system ATP-binding protein